MVAGPDEADDEADSGVAEVVVTESVSDGALGVLVGEATAGTSSVADGGTVKVMPGGTVASGSRSTTLADRSLNWSSSSCFCCPSSMVAT